ncbi:hypothetical protein JdFRA1000001_20c [uncultured archaeal virus]|uniref:Uncharacterized protein n=1 Tax=uncultured archaeal virus TaxID=1960247 RepID=A0A1S5Y336_9VIRU|nr:hypothetical protein JdFRA1000001_20c [uncultured archaeal virus]
MRKGNVNTVLLVIILLILVGGALGLYMFYRNVASIKLLPWLSTEIGDKPVLTLATLSTIEPGQVYQVVADKQGWQVKLKDTQLYEYLKLENIDLRPNDVIAPHLYDFYVSALYDYVRYDKTVSIDTTTTPWYWTIVTTFKVNDYVTDVEAGFSYAIHTIAGFTDHWGGSVSFRTDETYGHIKKPSLWIINTEFIFGDADYNDWITISGARKVIDANNTVGKATINGVSYTEISGSNTANAYAYTASKYVHVGEITTYHATDWVGRIAYAAFYLEYNDVEYYNEVQSRVLGSALFALADPTFYNGSSYFLHDGTPGTPNNNIIRIPAEQTWMWFISSLASDNKLHFKWFPEGSIIQIKDQNGNVLRKFTVSGSPVNDDEQIEDYSIDLNTDLVSQATIEAWVPSQKVRVYGPYGATIQIVDANGIVVGEAKIGSEGYVDIPIMESVANGQVIVQADSKASNNLDILAELNGNMLKVTVLDQGTPVPDLLVRVADPSGVVIASNTTDQSGSIEVNVDRPLPEATIEVSGIWNYQLVYQKQDIQLQNTVPAETSTSSSEQTKLLLLGAFLVVMIIAVILFTTKGIRVRT